MLWYVHTTWHAFKTKVKLVAAVMLFYDIAITFGDEVEKIWKRPFSGATVLWTLVRFPSRLLMMWLIVLLFFKNRYLSPLGYIVIIVCESNRWCLWFYISILL